MRALIDSIQIQNDSGIYQATIDTLTRFMRLGYGRCFIDSLAKLTLRRPDLASDLILIMANYTSEDQRLFIEEFNKELHISHTSSAAFVVQFIKAEERKSSFSDYSGILAKKSRIA